MRASMPKRKIFLIIGLFFLIITAIRFGWVFFHQIPDHPEPENGFVNLEDWEFSDKQPITLNGEWGFFPDTFLDPDDRSPQSEKNFVMVPDGWEETVQSGSMPRYGHGTYSMTVQLPEDTQGLYSIRMDRVTNDAQLFVNGESIKTFGNPATNAGESEAGTGPVSASFYVDSDRLNILVHVSNYEIPFFGGITDNVQFGTASAIQHVENKSTTMQAIVIIIYLLHSIYAFVIYFLGRQKYHQKELLYFGLLLLTMAFTISIDDNVLLHLPFSMDILYKLLLFFLLTVLILLATFTKHMVRSGYTFYRMGYRLLMGMYTLITLGIIIIPLQYFVYLAIGVAIFFMVGLTLLFVQTIKVIQQGLTDVIFILLFIVGYASNVIWGLGIKADFIDLSYYPVDFILSVLMIAILMFKRHMDTLKINTEQTIALQQADKRKNEFLSNTSHELRNPLHGIMNIAQSILWNNAQTLTAKNKDDLQLLLYIGQNMTYTLNDLLDVSKLRDHEIKLDKQRINLESIHSVVIEMIEFTTQHSQIDFDMQIPDDFPDVAADEKRLTQVLFNLIHNAVKYTNEGTISITAEYNKKMATVHITDTGIGISEQMQQRIFKPYEQEDTGLTSVDGGVGLGLTICRKLIELHGGTLSVESTPGEGSTFSFTLPLAVDEPASPMNEGIYRTMDWQSTSEPQALKEVAADEELESSPANPAHVLIVDNDQVNLRVIRNILTPNYHVHTAVSGDSALEQLQMGRWDLVISDIMMPGMSGYTLTQKIRNQYSISELPILLLTARNQPEDIQAGFASGANDYVAKPANASELLARVKALTELKQSISERLRMEGAWLQAQIQPHFLFNTLNTIASLGEMDTARMTKLLSEFGNYLQKSFTFRNKESLIDISEELALTNSYLYIQQERFGNRLDVHWDLATDSDLLVPPLSIQPIVENAVSHGILKQPDGGSVTIQLRIYDTYNEIAIIDNGVGIDAATKQAILEGQPGKIQDTGIGIANTNRRLRQLFGRGLEIKSVLHKGTRVSFRVPR